MNDLSKTIGTTLVAAGLLLAGGCQHDAAVYNDVNNSFAPDSAVRDSDRMLQAQASTGARADATLQPTHFSGNGLNSLGRAKLNLMLNDEEAVAGTHPVIVYLNVPDNDPTLGARRDAVSGYLVAAGVAAADIKVEAGRNPAAWAGSQPGLIRLPKTESPDIGGGTVGATVSVAGDGK